MAWFPSEVDTVGTLIDGTKYQVPLDSNGTTIGTITLTQGLWLVCVSGWPPANNGYLELQGWGYSTGAPLSVRPFSITQIVPVASSRTLTLIEYNVTQSENCNASYDFVAVKLSNKYQLN